jgi:hypothetical protein
MTDISLCRGCDHTLCKSCVRYTTLSNDTYQSYILGRVIKGECLDYWPAKKGYRTVDNIGELLCAWFSGETVIFENVIYDIKIMPNSTKKRTCKKLSKSDSISQNTQKRTCKKLSAKSHKRNKRKGTYK